MNKDKENVNQSIKNYIRVSDCREPLTIPMTFVVYRSSRLFEFQRIRYGKYLQMYLNGEWNFSQDSLKHYVFYEMLI